MKKVGHSGLEVKVTVAGNKQEIITEEGEGVVGEPSSDCSRTLTWKEKVSSCLMIAQTRIWLPNSLLS